MPFVCKFSKISFVRRTPYCKILLKMVFLSFQLKWERYFSKSCHRDDLMLLAMFFLQRDLSAQLSNKNISKCQNFKELQRVSGIWNWLTWLWRFGYYRLKAISDNDLATPRVVAHFKSGQK